MKAALTDIVDSRTFYIAIVDAVVSTLAVMLALFFNPTIVDKVLTVVAIWQPVVIAWITKIAIQNVAGIQAAAKVEDAKIWAKSEEKQAVISAEQPCEETPKP